MSDFGQIGFMLVMLTITWFNRMLNGTTSGKWTTIFLLTVSLTPPVLQLDDLILVTIMNKESGFIPFDNFNYTFFGIFWASLFTAITIFYQRSFHYAITNHRVIFTQHLIIPGDGRRIQFDNINEIRTQRTFLGAIFGYNTIICDTGSQLGIGEDSMSVSVGTTGGGTVSSNTRGVTAMGTVTPTVSNTIEYITIATTGDAVDFGDLTNTRSDLAAASSPTRGVFCGGDTPSFVNTIDYVQIMTLGNALDFGDQTVMRDRVSGCSNAHGGL